MELLFRFDRPRPFQDQMINDIRSSLESNNSILVNAPTGIGKTDASISAALSFAIENDHSVLFLTPKISQHRIAVECLKGIKTKFGNFANEMQYIDIVGKQNLCVNEDINHIDSGAFYRSCDTKVKNGKCNFFSRAKELTQSNIDEMLIEQSFDGHNALFGYCNSKGLCAYEISAAIAKKARVIIADYSHILNPNIRNAFLRKISHSLSNSIVIWDEAHNIINAANSYLSSSMSMRSIENAKLELESIGSKVDLDYLQFAVKSMAEKHLSNSKKESFANKEDMPESISKNIDAIIRDMENAGMKYSEEKHAKRSSILHIARFLSLWFDQDESIARIISKESNIPKLTISCLYPHKSIKVFEEARSNIFMSATLLPLNMYADLFGLKDAALKNYQSSFPKSNRVAFIDSSITTRYSSRSNEMYKKMADRIIKIKESFSGNMAVFFPSFDMIKAIQRNMPDGSSLYIQREGMKSVSVESLINDFKSSSDSIIFGVAGGSLSEGVDYTNNIIRCVVVAGIPLSKPDLETRAKISYLDRRFDGKGNDYAYTIPALMRAIQAAGRAIRSETDRAAIVFMDERYAWPTYYSVVNGIVQISRAIDYVSQIKTFLSGSVAITKQI